MRQTTIRLIKDGTVLGGILRKKGELIEVDPVTACELVAAGRAVHVTIVRARYDNALIGNRCCVKGEELELPEDLAVLAHNLGKATVIDPSTMLSAEGRAALREQPALPAWLTPRKPPPNPYANEEWVNIRMLRPVDGLMVGSQWVTASKGGVITIPLCLAEAAISARAAEWSGPRALKEIARDIIDLTRAREPRSTPITSS